MYTWHLNGHVQRSAQTHRQLVRLRIKMLEPVGGVREREEEGMIEEKESREGRGRKRERMKKEGGGRGERQREKGERERERCWSFGMTSLEIYQYTNLREGQNITRITFNIAMVYLVTMKVTNTPECLPAEVISILQNKRTGHLLGANQSAQITSGIHLFLECTYIYKFIPIEYLNVVKLPVTTCT